MTDLLSASPNFVQALSFDGRPFVAKDAEPYSQFWLSAREQVLLVLFSRRGGATLEAATADCLQALRTPDSPAARRRIARDVAGMRAAGVLVGAADDTSRYSAAIAADYLAHRPFPPDVTAHIVARAGVGPATRVLDLAGGPGDLAVQLARHSEQVALLELSKGFLGAARRRAKAAGRPLATLHDSANRLVYRDEPYDLITVSQALHWLDDVNVCRGACRLLQPGGSFVVIHAALDLPDAHPLAYLFGHDSILGKKARVPFKIEVQALHRRLALLFDALDTPAVDRLDAARTQTGPGQRIAAAGVQLWRQERPFGEGFARGFLTPEHIAVTGQAPEGFWAELQSRCEQAAPEQLMGTQHWAVLHFRRGATEKVSWRGMQMARLP